MGEARRVAFYTVAAAVLIAVAGFVYVWSQRAVDMNRGSLAIQQYIECRVRMATYDWSKFPGEKPSGSEVCKELASRRRT